VFLQDTERRKTQAACKQTADAAPVSERSPQEILDEIEALDAESADVLAVIRGLV
jgi:hypothetical protein